jgi:hypothetical protein
MSENAGCLTAELVYVRYFAGLAMNGSAEFLGLSLESTLRLRADARLWPLQEMERNQIDSLARSAGRFRTRSQYTG